MRHFFLPVPKKTVTLEEKASEKCIFEDNIYLRYVVVLPSICFFFFLFFLFAILTYYLQFSFMGELVAFLVAVIIIIQAFENDLSFDSCFESC